MPHISKIKLYFAMDSYLLALDAVLSTGSYFFRNAYRALEHLREDSPKMKFE